MHFSKPVVTQLVLKLVQETGQVGGCWERLGSFPVLAVQFRKTIPTLFSDFAQGCNEAQYYLLEVVSMTGAAKGSSKRCCICLGHTDFQAAKQ